MSSLRSDGDHCRAVSSALTHCPHLHLRRAVRLQRQMSLGILASGLIKMLLKSSRPPSKIGVIAASALSAPGLQDKTPTPFLCYSAHFLPASAAAQPGQPGIVGSHHLCFSPPSNGAKPSDAPGACTGCPTGWAALLPAFAAKSTLLASPRVS